ncbi:helix-turn-helix transcriptional regulator [Sinomonas sp. JGH33]|uniref:Helix-turn-helix transcriptional regulator n=1 Tax=Sinomonas terricola TaxID=3110330 RepID=A0ABU5T181_9MICC|nr:helix-turn-helix transcriptional regulator [Sinomonas sp. JGH33]MEA5453251.1 helix-turn-helix transcriptional regulator [Sinomonas sp. JGH33]
MEHETSSESSREEALYRAILKEVRLLMADREVTQEDIASRLGIRRETVSGYLSGATKKGMPTTVLIAVADILEEDLGELTRRAIERAQREG